MYTEWCMSVRRNWMSLRAFNSSWTREEKLNTISTRCINFVCLYWHKNSTNDHGLRMVTASPFIHPPDRVALKASGVSVADWRCQTRMIIRRLRIYESHVFELRIKTWMKVILVVMCTTLGSSENKSLRLYPQFKYMKKRKSIKKRFSFAKRKIQLYRGTHA